MSCVRKVLIGLFALIALAVIAATVAAAWWSIWNDGTCKCGDAERNASETLHALVTAQALFREGDRDKNGELDYARSLAELGRLGLVDGETATGFHDRYDFRIVTVTAFTWAATATPRAPRPWLRRAVRGDYRAFFVDESGVLRVRLSPGGEPATSTDLHVDCCR